MRYTVLAVDVLVYFTAAVVFSRLVYRNKDAMWERVSMVGRDMGLSTNYLYGM